MAAKVQKSSDLDEIWFPSRLWCCKLISIVGRQIVSGLRFQWKLISRMYFEVRNWLVMMKTKFRPNRRIFFILVAILDSKWSPYGEACLTPFKYPFSLKFLHLWIFSNLF
jgi:hypothetical protein